MAFKAVDAAFSGFRQLGREPGYAVIWALVGVLGCLAVMLAVAAVAAIGWMAVGLPFDPQAFQGSSDKLLPLIFLLVPLYFVMLLGFIFVGAVMTCAAYRSVFQPDLKGFARIRLGADEFRMMGLKLIVALLYIPGSIVVAVVNFALRGSGLSGLGLLLNMSYVIAFYAFFWLSAPSTFATRRLQVFAGPRMAQGRFWPIVGAMLLNALLGGLIMIGAAIVFFILFGAVGGYNLVQLESNPAAFNPAMFVGPFALGVVFWFGLLVVLFPTFSIPPAVGYRDIAGTSAERQAEAFS